MKILMVCLGNICRSPMAEGIMRAKLEDAGFDAVVDSAGTADYHRGESPDHRAVKCMKQHGIDISGLRARQFSRKDFEKFDFIFTMDESNHRNVMAQAETDEEKKKVMMFLELMYPGQKQSVPDPWFGDMDGFFEVAEMLMKASDKFVARISDGGLLRND